MRDEFSLREWKYAQTKASLVEATVSRLNDRALADVSVREICDAAEVSEATFFNYFPTKEDVLATYLQMWGTRVCWHVDREISRSGSGLQAVQVIFDETAQMLASKPGVMCEMVAYYAHGGGYRGNPPLTEAELALHFPDLEGVREVRLRDIYTLLGELLTRAIQSGELSEATDLELVRVLLMNVFFATYVTARQMRIEVDQVQALYRRQLALIWAGVRRTD